MLMTTPNPAFGDSIGRYRLVGEIARGGMGIVYVAAASGPAGFSKLVALKELRPDLVEDTEFLTMFLDEARMAARLNHPNIVQTNDVGEQDGRHFIAMEYLDGRSMYQILRRFAQKGGFPQRMAIYVLREALSALDYAHELTDFDGSDLGFVHRDVSPHNIFVTFDGHTKVIDFGIAKARDSSLQTKTGVLKGRASYMAPEQLTHHADRRTDVFSVGAILFELVTGRRLWQGMNELEILVRLTRGDIPSVQAPIRDTPAVLSQICQTALRARPEERFRTAADMRDALDEYFWSTGGVPKIRDISTLLMKEFQVERAKSHAILDEALARLAKGQGGQLESLATVEPREQGTGTMDSNRPRGSGANRSLPVELIAAHERANATENSIGNLDFGTLAPEPVRARLHLPEFLVQHRRVLGAACLSVVAATVTAIALHRSPPPPVEAVPIAEPVALRPVPAATLAAPAMPEMISFSVSVAPAYAQVLIDGEPMPSNPFFGKYPKSFAAHRIRAVAPGFQPKERLVTFAENVMLDLTLTPRPMGRESPPPRREQPQLRRYETPQRAPAIAPAPVSPPPVATPSRSSAPADIVPRNGSEPQRRRSIDSSNPYGEER